MKKLIAVYLIVAVLLTGLAVAWATPVEESSAIGATFEDNATIVLLIDPDTGSILYANSAAINFYGYTKSQLQQMEFAQLNAGVNTDAQTQADTPLSAGINTAVHRLSNGDERTVEVYTEPFAHGASGALLVMVRDQTGQALAASRTKSLTILIYVIGGSIIFILLVLLWLLLNSYRRIRSDKTQIENLIALRQMFMDASNNLVYLKDENLQYVFVNKAIEEFYHKPKEDILGHDDFSLSEKAFAQQRRNSDIEVLNTKTRITSESQWKGRLYQATKYPVQLTDGRIGVGAVVADITEERAQAQRRQQAFHRNSILLDVFTRSFDSSQELLDHVLHESLKLTGSKYGYVYLYDEQKREFTLNSWTLGVMDDCAITDPKTVYQLDKTGLWGDAVRSREPIIVNEFQKPHPQKKGYPQGHVEIETFMSVPVIIDDEIVAVIGFANNPKGYDDNDVYEITLLMSGAWSALSRHKAREKLSSERNKFLQTLLSIGNGVMMVDVDGNIDMLNRVAENLTGWCFADARGRHYTDVLTLSNEQLGKPIEDPIQLVLQSEEHHTLSNHAILTSKDGSRYALEDSAAPIRDDIGQMLGVVLVFRDITEKKQRQQEIQYLSFHDSLTGLYNRRFFEVEMQRLDTPRNLPIAVIMGDVNNLKLTNDIFGHDFGDALLKKLAIALKRVCRADEIIARWGGDEFVLLLPQIGNQEAERIVDRIKEEFAKEQVMGIQGSISMGFHVKQAPNEDIRTVFHEAEGQMYAVKSLEHEQIQQVAMDAIIHSLNSLTIGEREHAARVSELCTALGRALNLPEAEIRRLSDAGYLHDIGKIVLQPELLDKRPPLSSKERQEFRRHPLVGHRILSLFDPTQMLSESVLTHHESWDGSGYPKGLSGENIPLMGRIIAVAENYDRLINHPNDDHVLSPREALERIRALGGKKFDPKLVELFIGIMMERLSREEGN